MMKESEKPDLDGVARLYSGSLEEHGSVARGVGWNEADDHQLRFEKLTTVFGRKDEEIAVNDLGCGYGALYEYLRATGRSVRTYRGYDISEPMLEMAEEKIPGEGVEFIQAGSIDKSADYSFASGIFNVRLEHDEALWRDHVLTTLDNLNQFSTKGFAFNLLTSYVDFREEHLFYGDPLFFFDHCKRHLSPRVSLLHDYPLWEWTIVVRKAEP